MHRGIKWSSDRYTGEVLLRHKNSILVTIVSQHSLKSVSLSFYFSTGGLHDYKKRKKKGEVITGMDFGIKRELVFPSH
jgi:hypothetical protein